LRSPFVLKDRQQLGIVRRLGGGIFHDQACAGGVEHLRRIEDRNVEGRAAPLGCLQARDLVSAQNDRLGDRGTGGAAECRGENVAVGFVPGTGKGGGNERLCFRKCARGKNGGCAKRRGSSEQASAIHGLTPLPFISCFGKHTARRVRCGRHVHA